MPRQLNFPKTVGVRLSPEDGLKLQRLCAAAQRPPSDVLRQLVRLAEPTGQPLFQIGKGLSTGPAETGVRLK